MLRLVEQADKNTVEKYGFKPREVTFGYKYIDEGHHAKNVGALEILINWETKVITGYGFYPVGDRIVLRELQDMVDAELIITAKNA